MKNGLTSFDGIENSIFPIFILFTKTGVTTEILHYLWLQPHDRIKSWNYALELKCSENKTFQNTRKWDKSIDFSEYYHIAKHITLVPKGTATSYFGEESIELSQKLNIIKLSFSIPSEIFCMKPVFGTFLWAATHSGSLHSYEQTIIKLQLDLNGSSSMSAHMYEIL